ncbi:MAG: hypothetical protein MHM6MM_005240, partial [Cercozoa sp. M6MM]
MRLILNLDARKLARLRSRFSRGEDMSLTLPAFVRVCEDEFDWIHSDDHDTTQMLCQIFADIDVNADGNLDWDEFVETLVEIASNRVEQHKEEGTMRLVAKQVFMREPNPKVVDRVLHVAPVERLQYLPKLDRFLVFCRGSCLVKLVTPMLRERRELRGHRGAVLTSHWANGILLTASS